LLTHPAFILTILLKKDAYFLYILKIFIFNYSTAGAPTGHTPSHVPHSMQRSLSITKHFSPWSIQLIGQAPAHAPQLIHFSESILYAIFIFSFHLKTKQIIFLFI
jgi:hypothetical protein